MDKMRWTDSEDSNSKGKALQRRSNKLACLIIRERKLMLQDAYKADVTGDISSTSNNLKKICH